MQSAHRGVASTITRRGTRPGQPIVAGWCYSWLVALSAGHDSWTAPLDSCRLAVGDNPNQVAAQQVRGVLARLPAVPIAAVFAFDGGYDPVQLRVELAGTGAQILQTRLLDLLDVDPTKPR